MTVLYRYQAPKGEPVHDILLYEPVTLAGANELAHHLNVERNTIHQWRMRHPDFPKPLVKLKVGSIWAMEDVRAWMESR